MKDVSVLISGIEYKIRKLVNLQKKLEVENVELKKEIKELLINIERQRSIIKKLEDKYKILKISKTIEFKEGTTDAKLKINELVREIDKCLGLLNK